MHHIQYVLNHIYCSHHLIKTSYLKNFKICLHLNLNCLYWNFSFLNFLKFKLLCFLIFDLPELFRNLQQKQTLDLMENHLFILNLILLKICFQFVILIPLSFLLMIKNFYAIHQILQNFLLISMINVSCYVYPLIINFLFLSKILHFKFLHSFSNFHKFYSIIICNLVIL